MQYPQLALGTAGVGGLEAGSFFRELDLAPDLLGRSSGSGLEGSFEGGIEVQRGESLRRSLRGERPLGLELILLRAWEGPKSSTTISDCSAASRDEGDAETAEMDDTV